MSVSEIENDGLLRRTVLTVVTMLGAVIAILGTASLIALVVTSKAVGSSSATAQTSSEEVKLGPSGPAGAVRGKSSKSPALGNEI